MLPEAELFVMAEQMLVEVLGRIREQDQGIVLPPLYDAPGADQAAPLRRVVEHYAYDDAWVPDLLAGATMNDVGRDRFEGDLLGDDPQASITRIADAAIAAARRVTDPEAVVHAGHGDVSTRAYLQRTTIIRSLVAHYVATYLGSTACPLPEELARPLWELTAPDAEIWRSLGIFRDPLPLPENVSWRDRFLLSAGHQPHPLGH
jgi:hypothetical protein